MKSDENYNKIKEKSLKNSFRLFFQNGLLASKVNVWLAAMALLINIIDWLSLLIFLKPATENIILHYNVYFGVDITGKRIEAFILPAVGLIIFIINFLLSRYFWRNKEPIASHVLLAATMIAQISLIIATLSVIIINY